MTGLERMKIGIWADGTIAGVGLPGTQFGERPDLTVVDYVRADLHDAVLAKDDLSRGVYGADRRPIRSLLPGTAEKVRLIVEDVFGPGAWDGFQRYMSDPDVFGGHEWRFGGALGFGGKVHLSGGRLWVSCYPEDNTPIKAAAMRWVNRELHQALVDMTPASPRTDRSDA